MTPLWVKSGKKEWWTAPLYLFRTIWKEKNSRLFGNEEYSIQGLRHSFVCNFWAWSKLFLSSNRPPVVDFIDWLGLD